MDSSPILEIRDLDGMAGNICLFRKLHLTLDPGEKCTLSGASGSGKSTLLKMIMGFLPVPADTIFITGEELTAKSCWRLRKCVACVSQEPEIGKGKVCDILAAPFQYRSNRSLSFELKEAQQLFECFLLPADTLQKDMEVLSGGEKQRVALTAALLLKRKLLLLDEVAAALDARSKEAVRAYLASLKNTAILSVSHDVGDFLLSSRLEWMEDLQKGGGNARD
ncbi:MAG TPA: ATP-binding cassette domain-containing protein [Candidatus Hydrogenedentes bacterium]|jgi:polar amino acid transport system ATP-binding protein/putative ABC transport system ATP-binding protein|nr:MAG: putative ABC transporter ATP-binding protein YbbL [Candidatus Hydrogenedentes bacterium ADurb.Bin170]HNZ49003.1 ATP-binding cassette domain-containing protein [Candidatus Hydrogenedentota bacterium]HOD96163.1 ATP-binding cassette domain-containing protein [Candidatus Hydrogenedentota bacterium]HOH42568.1 ATP-binding cassette domain-containing protein [Candidatus Hydrogenedentota bacterium]HOR51624.1 ATP-binding cassette domain-containing protein [Candidatus Hydrogenedentota bacterium]